MKKGSLVKIESVTDKAAETKENDFNSGEFRNVLESYLESLRKELSLYNKEFDRALERYYETKEPMFYINGTPIPLEDIPLIIRRIRSENIGSLSSFSWGDPNRKYLKNNVWKANCYLREQPGARIPEKPELIERWLRSN